MSNDSSYPDKNISAVLDELVQRALENKNTQDGENARRWAIVRTELEKISAYVKQIEQESVS